MSIWGNLFGKQEEEAMANPFSNALQAQQAAQQMSGALGGSSLQHGLGSGYLQGYTQGTNSLQEENNKLQAENNRVKWELHAQKSIRAQDSILIKRHYRFWAWLNDTHPEVVKEFESVEALLKASGEEF